MLPTRNRCLLIPYGGRTSFFKLSKMGITYSVLPRLEKLKKPRCDVFDSLGNELIVLV